MRASIIMCFMTFACAEKSGYNYEANEHSDNEINTGVGDISLGSSSSDAIDYATDNLSSPSSYSTSSELEKEFYTFNAPEEEFEDAKAAQHAISTVKQGLRVVFIKGPDNRGFENAALTLAKHASQQQTAIYVLNKQADIGELAHKLNIIGKNTNNRPEVHFVKYRTAEDAANAQRAIQSQYDLLGGNTQNINGGTAPVLNFASQSAVRGPNAQLPKNSYLPSSVFRSRF